VYHIKLTNARGYTYGGTYWEPGARHEAAPGPTEICTDTAIHFYSGGTLQEAISLAVHMNPIHANFWAPRAWVFEPEGEVVSDDGTKCGCKAGTTVTEVPLPKVTVEQRAEVAIRCALKVHSEERWVAWAEKWLSGEDRSWEAAAGAAARAIALAAWAAARAARAAEAARAPAGGVMEVETRAARAAELATDEADTPIAKIAAEVYYREEGTARCTT
jgi:hypothetical protein